VSRVLEERVEQLWRQHERRRRWTVLGRSLLLTVVLLTSIPLTFVAGATTGVTGIIVVWVGLIVLTALALLLLRSQ
jgi:protein-S-isoprenylcysteine O-methyltransferase Ste14